MMKSAAFHRKSSKDGAKLNTELPDQDKALESQVTVTGYSISVCDESHILRLLSSDTTISRSLYTSYTQYLSDKVEKINTEKLSMIK